MGLTGSAQEQDDVKHILPIAIVNLLSKYSICITISRDSSAMFKVVMVTLLMKNIIDKL